MASLKECRAKAKKLSLRLVVLPKTDYWYKRGERYKAHSTGQKPFDTKIYAPTIAGMSKMLSAEERRQKKSGMMHKLDGHRPKYGYKTVPRKKREAARTK